MDSDSLIKNGELLHDLHRNNYRIIQNPSLFRFGMDAVLLSGFAKAHPGDRVMDLCCGNGIISLLMQAKNEGASYFGIDIQEDCADMARRSVRLNGLEDQITIQHGDIRRITDFFVRETFNVVTVNPPYITVSSGKASPTAPLAAARHETLCTFGDIAHASRKLLRFGGTLYLVHRPDRLTDVLSLLRLHKVEPKTLRFVQPYAGKPPMLFLLSAVKGANPGLRVGEPMIVHESPGVYTCEVHKLYYE